MDLTIFGVKIDPTGAEQGANRVEAAAQKTVSALEKADKATEKASANMGKAAKRAGDEIKTGAEKGEKAVESLGKTTAWDRMRAAASAAANGVSSSFAMMGRAVLNTVSTMAMMGGQMRSSFGAMGQSVVDMANALGLMNSPLGNMILRLDSFRRVVTNFITSARSAGQGGRDAAAGIAETGTASALAAVGVTSLTAVLVPLVALLAVVGAGAVALGASFALIKSSINQAAEFETMKVQLAILLGSFDKAKGRLEELKKFAAATPFELPEVVAANITLERLTNGAYSSTAAMKQFGDAVAMAKQPMEEMAVWVGRLYSGLKAGAPVGEATNRLSEVGIISQNTKNQIEQLQKTASKTGPIFAEAWKMVTADMDRSKNAMLLMAGTWKGIMSNISDAWGQFKGALGEPIMNALKPAANEFANWLGSLKDIGAEIGQNIAAGVTQAHAAIQTMMTDGGLQLTWDAAATSAADLFRRGMEAAGIVLDSVLQRAIYDGLKLFEQVQKPEFWKGLEDALYNAAASFVNAITQGLREAYNTMLAIAKLVSPMMALASPQALAGMALRQPGAQAALTNGPRPEIVGPSAAWAQTQANPSAALTQWQQMQQANVNALNAQQNSNENDSLLPKPSTGTGAAADIVQDGKKTDLLAQMQSRAKAIVESTQTPLEELNRKMKELDMLRANNLLTQDEWLKASKTYHQEYVKSLEEMAEKARTPLQKLLKEWGDMKKQSQQLSVDMAQAVSGSMTGALTDLVMGTKSAKEAFADMANAILNDITQMIIKMLVQYAIQTALGWVGAGSAPSSAAMAGVHHTGGTVGDGGNTRAADPSAWGNAPRYAIGGTVPGVSSGERAIIAEPGETVLTREQTNGIRDRFGEKKQADKGGAKKDQSLTIANFTDPEEFRRYLEGNPHVVVNIISKNRSMVRAALGER